MSIARSGTVVSRAVHRLARFDKTLGLPCGTYRERIASDRPAGCRIEAAMPADGLRGHVNRRSAES